jgi:hypothetical protein
MKPFIYWFGFEDNVDDQFDIHFYQTIILALSAEEALSWGDNLAKKLIEKGEAKSIHSSWIEDVVQFLLTPKGSETISWENISHEILEQYYQGTASTKDESGRNINSFIVSKSEKEARDIWRDFLLEYYPNHKIETCTKPAISITQVGMLVDWL